MSTKQVTITVTQSIHQVDKNGKVKKSLTTYEVMKPVEAIKQVATQNTWVQGDIGRSQKMKIIMTVKEIEQVLWSDRCRKHKNLISSAFNTLRCMFYWHVGDFYKRHLIKQAWVNRQNKTWYVTANVILKAIVVYYSWQLVSTSV